MTIHGWIAAPDEMLGSYAQSCFDCASDEEKFKNFKKDSGYRTILEGAPKLFFDYYIEAIKSHENSKTFLDNLDKFKINDTVGNPDTYVDPEVGEFSPSTLKFAFNAIDILEFVKTQGGDSKIKNIVEIGGGYGGLCLILSGFIEWDQYTLIDLPETCLLVDKYVSHFPEIKDRVKTIPCNRVDEEEFGDIDLAIAINSLSECNLETQLNYFDKIISKSKLSYIVRNPDTQERANHHTETINSLSDNFLVDDSNRVEEWYSSNIIVYIKRDD